MRSPARSRRAVTAGLAAAACSVTLLLGAGPADARVTRDPCLTGSWRMGAAESTALLQQLVGLPSFTVTEGTITMAFGRGRMTYGSTVFVLRGDLGGQQFTAEASFLTEAPYRTRAGKIVNGRGTSEISYGEMTATKDGQTYSVPGPAGRTESVAAGSTPYTCTRSTLRWAVPTSGGSTMATFRRA